MSDPSGSAANPTACTEDEPRSVAPTADMEIFHQPSA